MVRKKIGGVTRVWGFITANVQQLTLIVNFLGFIVLGLYTHYTGRTLEIAIEKDIKPVMLLGGNLEKGFSNIPIVNFSDADTFPIKANNLRLVVLRNIVLDITGTLVMSGQKYDLAFANSETSERIAGPLGRPGSGAEVRVGFNEKWGWLSERGQLIFVANAATRTPTKEKDQIRISFLNITGKKYIFTENDKFEQRVVEASSFW